MVDLIKYPRTRHLEGSRLQPGDEDLASATFSEVAGRFLVVEEKVDGANAGLSFDAEGRLLLQSRGHFLTGGGRERHFHLFKTWANVHRQPLWERLGDRYVLFGEWLYAKHTIFYDRLPHYFLEFDLLDRADGSFLSTERRRALLAGLPVASVPVLHQGPVRHASQLRSWIGPSRLKSPDWKRHLAADAAGQGIDAERLWRESDGSDQMEGLYVKVEEGGEVVGRYKLVRATFLTSVTDSGSHWLDRPIVPNRLAEGVDLFRMAS